MSVGSIAPVSQGTTVNPVRSRSEPRPMHKVSFKFTRPKHSKAKQLTTSELCGIGLSLVLSFVFALIIVYFGIKVVPVIAQLAADIIRELMLADNNIHQRNIEEAQSRKLSQFLTVNDNINCSFFASNVADKNALLFTSQKWDDQMVSQIFTTYSAESIQLQTIESIENPTTRQISSSPDMSLTIQEFQAFEWSLNPQVGHLNHYVSDLQLLNKTKDLASMLQIPTLPNSVEQNDTCTLRYPPFRDFVPEVVSFGKNTPGLSGRGFHAHRRSVSLLLSGRKHWAIFAPNQVPASGFNPLDNLHDWRSNTQLAASDPVAVEIIQEAGQAVYIPEGWYHATETLSENSISVRYQPAGEQAGQYYYYLSRGDQKVAMGDAAAAVKLYRLGLALQKDATLLSHLGRALELLGLFADATEAYKEAIARSPRDPFLYTMLINLYVTQSSKDASTSISELLENAEALNLKSTVLELMKDSF